MFFGGRCEEAIEFYRKALGAEVVMLGELARLMEAKKLIPVVSQTFPLAEFGNALDQIATRHTRGKIVLQVAVEPRS